VDLHRAHRATGGARRRDDVVGGPGVASVEERHARTVGGERLDDRAADAAAAACDEGGLAGKAGRECHARSPPQPEIAKPPSTTIVWPVILSASGRQRR